MKRTGTIETWRDASGKVRYRARVYLANGERVRMPLPEGDSRGRALERAKAMQEEEDRTGVILAERKAREVEAAHARGEVVEEETADEWFERYLPTVECGENHRGKLAKNWSKWIAPVIGEKTMNALTRDDVEDVRDALDRAIDAKALRSKTALNIWSTLTAAMKAASSARDRRLRVHPAPLHFAILPPKRGESRERPWIYPNEWRALAKCKDVPVEWRRTYAIALYTGLRPNELRVLQWNDVDFAGGHIAVSKAWDEATKGIKAAKTRAGQRLVPIEPALHPLLVRTKGKPADLVAPLLSKDVDRIATKFRAHLELAGVDRARLFADNENEEPVDFRSLRDSYATWLALAEVPDKRIQRRLGHKTASTTDGYIKAAESFDVAAIGAPFPELPTVLLATGLAIVA